MDINNIRESFDYSGLTSNNYNSSLKLVLAADKPLETSLVNIQDGDEFIYSDYEEAEDDNEYDDDGFDDDSESGEEEDCVSESGKELEDDEVENGDDDDEEEEEDDDDEEEECENAKMVETDSDGALPPPYPYIYKAKTCKLTRIYFVFIID